MPPLQIILALLQVLPPLVADVEALFAHKAKSGTEKKSYVLDVVGRGFDLARQFGVHQLGDPGLKETVLTAAGALTDGVVAGFNAAQAFQHTPQT